MAKHGGGPNASPLAPECISLNDMMGAVTPALGLLRYVRTLKPLACVIPEMQAHPARRRPAQDTLTLFPSSITDLPLYDAACCPC